MRSGGRQDENPNVTTFYLQVPMNKKVDPEDRRREVDVMIKENRRAFNALQKKYPRLTIGLTYMVTVDVPEVLRKRGYEEVGEGNRREESAVSPSSMSASGSTSGESESPSTVPRAPSRNGGSVECFVSQNRMEKEWPGCSREHVMRNLPAWPEGMVEKTEHVSLHEVALHLLMEYTGCISEDAVLGCSVNALRAIHALALGLSGALRHELGCTELSVEKKARGNLVLGRAVVQS